MKRPNPGADPRVEPAEILLALEVHLSCQRSLQNRPLTNNIHNTCEVMKYTTCLSMENISKHIQGCVALLKATELIVNKE